MWASHCLEISSYLALGKQPSVRNILVYISDVSHHQTLRGDSGAERTEECGQGRAHCYKGVSLAAPVDGGRATACSATQYEAAILSALS